MSVEGAHQADRVPLAMQEQLFQIAREALNNVLKHARAQHVRVHVQFKRLDHMSASVRRRRGLLTWRRFTSGADWVARDARASAKNRRGRAQSTSEIGRGNLRF